MEMVVRVKKEHVYDREGGRIVKEQILNLLPKATPENRVVFDFAEVDMVTNSFADEVFGKLIRDVGFPQFKAVTTFRNANSFVTAVIRSAIYSRNEQWFKEQAGCLQ